MPNVAIRGVIARLCLGLAEVQPDAELLENYIATRDEAAFASLVQRHGPKVFAVCRRLLGQHQLAEDAYQATFVVLAKKAHTIQPRSAVGGFLYGVARKAALEAYAVSRRRKETLVETIPDSPAAPSTTTDSDVLAMLDEEIANLSDAYRAAVVLCELDGVGRADAALQLGIAEGTLSSRLAAARKQLATRLKARGVVFSAGLMSSLALSANAAIPPTIASATTAVSLIATGVLRTMLLAKFKLVTAICVLVTAIIGMSTFVPKSSMEAKAAPVPKVEKDEGLLWMQDAKTGTLTAFTIDGKKEREIKLKAGRNFKGFSADGETLLFLARKGQLTDEEDGLTLHLGKPSDLAGAIDTGIECSVKNHFFFLLTRDKKRVVRIQDTRNGTDPPVNRASGLPSFNHTLIDLATKKETAIELTEHMQIVNETHDGKEWIAMEYNTGEDLKRPGNRYLRIPVNGGKPIPICDTHQFPFFVPSPDGQSYLGLGVSLPPKGELKGFTLYHFNPKTGKATEREVFADTDQRNVIWSPDGKRFAMKKLGDADLYIGDIDGTKLTKWFAIPDAGPETYMIGWFAGKQKIAAPVPKVAKEEGLLWMFDKKASTLTAYMPDGEKAKTIAIQDGKHFLGFTEEGTKILFAGKNGKLADPGATLGLTLHLRDLNDSVEGTDTGLGYQLADQFVFSPDMKKVVRSRTETLEDIAGKNYPRFSNVLFDLVTKIETPIDVPNDFQIVQWSADGKSWRAIQNNLGLDPKLPNYRWHTVPVMGGKPTPFNDKYSIFWLTPSPDGKTLLGTGYEHPLKLPAAIKWFNVTGEKATVTPVAQFEKVAFLLLRWSPDGRQVAYVKHEFDPETGITHDSTLYVCNPDGSDTKKLKRFVNDNQNTTFLGWFPTKIELPKQPISSPVPKGDGREEVIVAYHAGRPVLLNENGKMVRELFAEGWGGSTGRAMLSKDGRQIAMLTDTKRDATGWMFRKLYLRDVDGKGNGEELMPEGLEAAVTAIWSPDGKSIYTSGYVTKKTIVDGKKNPNYASEAGIHHRIDIASKQRTELTLPAGHQIMDVSPDGKSFLTYVSHMHNAKETYKVCLVGMDGKVMDDLTDGSAPIVGQRFSPDGKKVVALSYNDVDNRTAVRLSEVFVLDVAAKEKMVVLPLNGLHDNAIVQSLAWSPDGSRIAFSWWTEGRTKGEPKDTLANVSIATLDDARIRTIFRVKDKTMGSIDWASIRVPEAAKP